MASAPFEGRIGRQYETEANCDETQRLGATFRRRPSLAATYCE